MLRQRLQATPSDTATLALPAVSSVPAEVLSQRPDLYAAQREVAAASADLGSAQAQRYPRLMLNGSVGTLNYSTQGNTTDLSTWSIGPVILSLPILDGGRRVANVQAAQARYNEAEALYRAKVRQAVREVEESLLQLATPPPSKKTPQPQPRATVLPSTPPRRATRPAPPACPNSKMPAAPRWLPKHLAAVRAAAHASLGCALPRPGRRLERGRPAAPVNHD